MKEYSRYERQMLLKAIGREGQYLLDRSRVAIVGTGTLGSVSSNLLARAGVGIIRLIDRDFRGFRHSERETLFQREDPDENLPKAVIVQKRLQRTNSEIQIEARVADLNPDTVDSLLEDIDLVVDGTDNFETRFLINDYALATEIPWIYGGAVGTEGMSYVILPGETPCLRCLFGKARALERTQVCDQVGILASVAHGIASFQAAEAIKILAGRMDLMDRCLWKLDVWSRQYKSISVEHKRNFPCSGCLQQDYPYLNPQSGAQAVVLHGRNAVQIFEKSDGRVNFAELARRLGPDMRIRYNVHLFQLRLGGHGIVIFPNGRALVEGTEDMSQARRLYAEYIEDT